MLRTLASLGHGIRALLRPRLELAIENAALRQQLAVLNWFRRIYSAKYDSSKSPRRKGRPPKPEAVRDLVIQLAQENLSWGYTKLRDVVNKGLQIDICGTSSASTWPTTTGRGSIRG